MKFRWVAIACAGWLISACGKPADSRFNYSAWVRQQEKSLTAHAEAVVAGKLDRRSGQVSFDPPALTEPTSLRIISVTKDANQNVYFITDRSFVTFNIGVVYKTGDLLGDGQEPRIAYTEHLFGRWWLYEAN